MATGIDENKELAENMAQRASLREVTLRDELVEEANTEKEPNFPPPVVTDANAGELPQQVMSRLQRQQGIDDERDGVLKARLSDNWVGSLITS